MVATSVQALVHVTLAGKPAPGVAVSWILPAGNGTISSTSSTTDTSGVATTTWTLGDTARVYNLTAAITGASVTLSVKGTAGSPTTLAKVSPDTIAVSAGASTLVTVRATDHVGNPVAGVVVSWTTTGGALTAATTTTGGSGNGEVVLSTDPTPQSYTVTATAPGLGTVTFVVIGK
jgi:adhesin/invasin